MRARTDHVRRGSAVVGAAFAVLLLGAIVGGATPARADEHGSTEHGSGGATGLLPPGDWTPAQVDYARELVQRTEQVLPRFGDYAKLRELGFEDFGATAPGGYEHWHRPDSWDDEHIVDPEFPENLVFQAQSDGGKRLVAAMFQLRTGTTLATIPPDLAWLPGWHTHNDELCVNDERRFTGIQNGGQCASGHPIDTPPMMHVWIVDNECGHRFAGIGVGGIECGAHHGRPPSSPPRVVPGTRPPSGRAPDAPPGGAGGKAPPAKPVAARPTYTG